MKYTYRMHKAIGTVLAAAIASLWLIPMIFMIWNEVHKHHHRFGGTP